jgi:hypothetical protein
MSAGYAVTLRPMRSGRWLVTSLAVIAGCLALPVAVAQAGQGNSTTPTFPVGAKVGDTAIDASISIVNSSTPPQSGGTSTICNVGDAGQCAGDEGITLVPSCGLIDPMVRTCTGPDPGVFGVTSPPVGATGSGCAGIPFDVTVADATLGKLRFTPQNGVHISLSPGATCTISFQVSVLKMPTADIDPATDGIQTKQLASSRLVASVAPTFGQGTGTSFGTTVNPPPPPPPPPPPTPPPPPPIAGSSGPGPGTAQIAGETGCATQNFNVTVTGQHIREVTFFRDSKLIKRLTRPNVGRAYRIRVRPGRLREGTHRIVARTTFTAASGTPARRLRVVFQRCARSSSVPNFTG